MMDGWMEGCIAIVLVTSLWILWTRCHVNEMCQSNIFPKPKTGEFKDSESSTSSGTCSKENNLPATTLTNYGPSGNVANNQNIQSQQNYFGPQNALPESNSNEIFGNMQSYLKTKYRNLHIPVIPWLEGEAVLPLDELYVELRMMGKDLRGREVSGKKVTLENVFRKPMWFFQTEKPYEPKRVLIEGPEGFGKSTLCHKVAYDWAHDAWYLRQFELTFLLRLRTFTDSFEAEISSVLGYKQDSQKAHVKEIKRRKVLMILDGYDEMSDKNRTTVNDVLQQKLGFYKMTVLLTSRPEVANAEEGKLPGMECSEGTHADERSVRQLFDMRLVIKGIENNLQDKFLKKHLKTFKADTVSAFMRKFKSDLNLRK